MNGTYYEAAVPSRSGSKEFIFPFDTTTFGPTNTPFYTGFAVADLDQAIANITCTARDSLGNILPNAVVVPSLKALGHWSNYLFPMLTGLRGTIDCVSNTNTAAIALRFIGTKRLFFTPHNYEVTLLRLSGRTEQTRDSLGTCLLSRRFLFGRSRTSRPTSMEKGSETRHTLYSRTFQ